MQSLRSRYLHPVNQRGARANDYMALVDDVTVRHELITGSEHSSRPGGQESGSTRRYDPILEVIPKDACHQARGRGVGLQHEGIGGCFRHGVRVEVLSRHMRRGLHSVIETVPNHSLELSRRCLVGRSLLGCHELQTEASKTKPGTRPDDDGGGGRVDEARHPTLLRFK